MKYLNNLSSLQREELLRTPLYIAFLITNSAGTAEMGEGIDVNLVESFSTDEELKDFYKKVIKRFKEQETMLQILLPMLKEKREKILVEKLQNTALFFKYLNPDYGGKLLVSLENFSRHVSAIYHGRINGEGVLTLNTLKQIK